MNPRVTLVIPFLTLTAAAQEPEAKPPLEPRHFFLADCENLVFVDLKQLREREIWDELQRSAIGMALGPLEKEGGFPLADLDRVWMQALVAKGGERPDVRQIGIFEGNQGLALPESVSRNETYQKSEIGGCTVFERSLGRLQELIAVPRPELRIFGTRELIEPVLLGERRDGLPTPMVQSLLSGRGDNVVYVIFDARQGMPGNEIMGRLIGTVEWPEDDVPSHLLARVRITGEADDPHLEVEVILRHPLGKAGLDASEAAAKAWLESLQSHPRLGALKHVWKTIEIKRDRADLVLRKDLGRSRDAVGTLALMLAPVVQR